MAEFHRHIRNVLRHGFEQRLKRVLRDDLIGLERHRAVGGGVPPGLGLRHGRMGHLEQRRPHQVEQQIGVHRPVRRIARRAHGLGEAEAAENLHRPRIAALHFRIAERRVVLLDQRAADAAPAEIDGERQADRPGPDDEHLGIHSRPFAAQARAEPTAPFRRSISFPRPATECRATAGHAPGIAYADRTGMGPAGPKCPRLSAIGDEGRNRRGQRRELNARCAWGRRGWQCRVQASLHQQDHHFAALAFRKCRRGDDDPVA